MHKTQLKPAANPAGRTPIFSRTRRTLSLMRHILFAVLLICSTGITMAQNEVITVGNGTNSTNYGPFGIYYNNATFAMIYNSSDIGQSGCITKIEFYCSTRINYTCTDIKVYMLTTASSSFTNSSTFPSTSDCDLVYSSNGSVTIGSSTGWYSITLDEPFEYNTADGNLEIIVTKKASSYSSTSAWQYTSATNTVLYRWSDGDASYGNLTATTGSTNNNRPNIRLTFKKFYFSTTAIATPSAGGTASTSPATTEVIGSSCNSATTTATFTANPNSGYRFIGWSTTENGAIISSSNPYNATITSTSTNSASPTNTTLYARFQANVNPTSISTQLTATTYVGTPLDVSYTLSPSGAYDHVAASSNNTGVFTVPSWGNNGSVTITPIAAGQATLTLTPYKLDNSTITPATVTVTVRDKVAKPDISFEPIDNGSTATATITCATPGITIYYTVNGSDPTNSSTQYSSAFTVNDDDVVKAIAIKTTNGTYWDNSDVATETYVSCTTPKPVITYIQSGNTATVTITADAGAVIYYTTNGSAPTTSSSQYTAPIANVSGNTTIKAIAKNGSCRASDVVSETIILSGVSDGGVVTLNDREDHSWSYYSDETLPEQLRSLNPANVKITYYGNGTDNISTTNGATPASNSWTEDATGVKVGPSDNYNTFVYYKTLERLDGSTSNSPTGLCAYTTIPNPFQVRPTYSTGYGNGSNNTYTGFYMWRIKAIKNGKIYDAATNGSQKTAWTSGNVTTSNMLYAEGTYYFEPDDEYGMEVELEALWARAYVVTASGSRTDVSDYDVGVERNFVVITSNSTYNLGAGNNNNSTTIRNSNSRAFTVTSRYPNGDNGNSNATFMGANTTLTADTKIENIKLGNYTLTAAGYNLTIGRGCTGTVANLYGATSAPSSNFSMRIESGSFTSSYILYFSRSTQVSSGITMNATYGCDFDRANNETNTNLTFSNVVEVGYYAYCSSANAKINMTVLSGTYGSNADNKEFYLGFENAGTNSKALRTLEVYGGNFLGGIAGGTETTGNANSTTTVSMRVRGGTIHRYLYGAGQYSETSGARRIVITGGTFDGWIAGGAYGTKTSGGKTSGDIYLYFGGNANQTSSQGIYGAGYGSGNYTNNQEYYTVQKSNVVVGDDAQVAGNVYGGGNNGFALDNIKVFLTGATVAGDVYGGANKAPSSKDVTVTVKGGSVTGGVYGGSNQSGNISGQITVDVYGTDPQPNSGYSIGQVFGGGNVAAYSKTPNVTIYCDDNISIGEVYGGGNNASVSGTNVTVSGGNRIGYVYGGGRQAAVNGNTSVKVYGGTIEHVFAGNNISGTISGTLSVEVDRGDDDCLLKIGELYGGGNQAASKAGSITIGCTGVLTDGHNNLSSTNRIGYELEGIGDVYGGANNANITSGNITLNIQSGMIARVFGGNNVDGTISGNISVSINKNSSTCGWYVGDVFGAGNLATYTGNPQVSILNGHVSGNVYGGGKGQLVDGNQRGVKGKVTGSPSITIGDNVSGHTVSILGEVYGGGDAADVTGTPVIVVNDHSTAQSGAHVCSTHIGYLYGGGNAADVGGTNITINGGTITNSAFGGGHGDKDAENPSKYADVNGNVVFNIKGGHISKVFAGSNSKGNISGSSTLTIEKSGNCPMIIGEVYGGGNLAAGNAGTININCTGDLVAGNSGQEANPSNIGVSLEGIGTVYGGANAADIGTSQTNSNITLNINSGMVANVFGGNNQTGNIYGTIQVNINKGAGSCGWYVGNVFGGGNLAIYSGTPEVNIKNGTVSGSVYGGGNGDPNDQSQQKGQVAGSTVTIGDNTNNSGFAVVVGNVYGGGNAARVTGNTQVTYNDSNSSSYVAKLFGGGNAANVNGTTNVTLTNGKVTGGVYGGCNTTGSVGAVTVALSGGQVGATGDGNEANVYGGGFGSPTTTTGNISVTLTGTTVYGDIYGGSALGSVNASTSNTTTININGTNKLNGTIYGGGMGDNSTNPAKTAVSNGNVIINYTAANTGLKKGIYGGANINGNVKGKITLNINANVGASGDNNSRNIFGGGLGAATSTEGSITVNIGNASSTPTIYGDVYGGSALGSVNKLTTDVDSINFNKGTINGFIFGGGQGDNSTKAITNGKTVVSINTNASNNIKGVYGGANVNGNVKGDIVVNVYANVGATGDNNSRDIFGGGLGQNTDTEGNVTVNIGSLTYDANKTPTIYGDIYGGSAKGNVNKLSTQSTTYYTRVNFQNGTLHGNIYGGGLGQKADDENSILAILAKVNGWVEVNIGSNSQSSNDCKIDLRDAKIFGGNNTNGSPQDSVAVRIYNTAHNYSDYSSGDRYKASYKPAANETEYYAIKEVFGGGNEADYTPVITNASYIRRTGVYVIGCDNTIERVFSGGNAAAATGVATHIDGGRFDYIYGGGNGEDKAANIGSGGTNLNVHGGIVNCLFGGSNHSGTISGPMRVNVDGAGSCSQNMYIAEFFCGNNEAPVNTNINATIGCGTKFGDVYGGCNKASIDGDVILTIKGGEMNNVYGGSKGTQSDSANIKGNVTLNVYGGIIKKKAFGGSNINGNITGKITVNLDWSQADVCDPAITLRVDSIFGGSNLAEYTPSTKGSYPEVNIKHGTVGYVFGGGKGATAIVHSNPVVTIGDSNTEHYAIVNYNVYGGGDAAAVDGYTVVTYDDEHANSHVGNLFGGGNAASVSGTATVTLTNGKVTSGIYGGCNASGSIGGKVTLNLNDGSVGTSSNLAGVYGGGLGAATRVNGDIEVKIAGSTIYGDVYGGSAKGVTNCNDAGTAHNGTSKTDVNLSAGTVYGSIYGGGHGIDNAAANVWGPVMVTVNGGSVQKLNGSTNPASIFGCNNLNGSPKDSVVVKILTTNATVTNNGVKTYAINGVYGGGNEAHYDPTTTNVKYPKVTVECGTSIKYVFGGGNAAAVPNTNVIIYGGDIDSLFAGGNGTSGPAHVGYKNKDNNPTTGSYGGGNTSATIYGGNIRHIFGGSNANGVIRTNGPLVINKTGSCDMIIGEVYGGGNQADGNASEISILNTGTLVTGADGHAAHPENIGVTLEGIGTVYGGANAADIGTISSSSNIELNINSGMIANVFGGNNTRGTIYGTVLVNINQNQSSNWYVGNVFGGGNLADYSGATIVNITNGEVSQNVYGGGNEAGVGAATVNINGGTVKKAVYGGCNTSGTVTGDIAVNFTSGTIGTNTSNSQHIYGIFGGGYGSSTVTEGDVIVTIGNGTSAPVVYGDVYGGSALGIVNDSTAQTPQTTKVWLKSGTVNGYVYGGGLGDNAHPALVFGDVQVVVDGGSVTEKIFGCNNVNGTPRGSVQVDINSTNSTQINNGDKTYALKGVYGGGNLANYVPTTANSEYPKVTVACGTSVKEVFGGGNAASVPNTNVIINGGDIDLVFAGGNGTDGAAHVGYNSKADNPAANTSYGDGNTSAVIHGGTINKIFGGSNANGIIRTTGTLEINKNADCAMYIGQVYGGGNEADGNASAISILNTGTLVTGDNGHAANPDAIGITLEGIQTVFGGANNANVGSSASNNAALSLTISSGMVANVFGGNNTDGEIYGTVEVNIDKNPNGTNWYVGNVFGAGKDADYTGNPNTYIKNGTVSGNVYGGGQGVGAVVKGNPKVEMTGGTVNGNIFGGGDAADVTGIVTVNIKGGTVVNDVYGGGALANTNIGNATNYGQANESVTSTTTNYTTVNLTGGTVKNVYGGGLGDADTEAKVYGNVFVNLNKGVSTDSKGAVITDYLFGCNNINGTPLGSVTVFVQGTQNSGLGTMLAKNNDSYDMKAIYGGGNLAAYIPKADTASTHVIINACRTASIEYVYGGGNAAPVPATDVKIYGSYKIGSLFGGGNGLDSIYVNGVKEENPGADVGIHKVSLGVFNDTDEDLQYKDPGHEKGNDNYILYGDTTGTSIIGTTHVTFYGGIVGHLFGGSNTKGDIIKKSNVILGDEDLLTCDFSVDDVYGGSNEAYMSGSAAIEMNCVDGMEQIYGGSRMADVNDDIVLTITGGKYGKVFGGNNISGRIFGSITVNIVQTGCLPIVIGELYGGGNQAPYSVYGYNGNSLLTPEDGGPQLYDDPIINIISCDSIGKVFGGGLGATAKMIGNPHVNINMIKGWTNGDYRGNGKQNDPHGKYKLNPRASETIGVIDTVFGGGNEAIVQGQTYINIGTDSIVTIKQVSNAIYKVIKNSVSVHGTPFASNDGDAVTKDLTISIEGANITGNVYGGGNNANVTGGTNIVVGREGQQQQQQPTPNPAPRRPEQPQTQQPTAPQSNAATESQQTRTANTTRL